MALPHPAEYAPARQQLGVRPAFDEAALLEDEDLVDRFQSMQQVSDQ